MTPNYKAFTKKVLGESLVDAFDWDGGELQELGVKYGIIREVKGGYNPEVHGPHEYAEPGDTWYEFVE